MPVDVTKVTKEVAFFFGFDKDLTFFIVCSLWKLMSSKFHRKTDRRRQWNCKRKKNDIWISSWGFRPWVRTKTHTANGNILSLGHG